MYAIKNEDADKLFDERIHLVRN